MVLAGRLPATTGSRLTGRPQPDLHSPSGRYDGYRCCAHSRPRSELTVPVTLRLPECLQGPDDTTALGLLKRYYGPTYGEQGWFTGSLFDIWDSTGTRQADTNRFTADDLLAVTFLSVRVPPAASTAILCADREHFNELLEAVGPDRDLVDEPAVLDRSWAGWRLDKDLRALPGIGATIASKLLARKRPRLRPVWDTVVADAVHGHQAFWAPMHVALNADSKRLHGQLQHLHTAAGLPDQVPLLRVLDVICWMSGKRYSPKANAV